MPFESTLVGKGTITTREKQVNTLIKFLRLTTKSLRTHSKAIDNRFIFLLSFSIKTTLFSTFSDFIQILLHEIPNSHYVLETEVCNDGVKYSDTFSLFIRYCLVQISPTTTNLRVTAQVRFCKPVNGIIKRTVLLIFIFGIKHIFPQKLSRKMLILHHKKVSKI